MFGEEEARDTWASCEERLVFVGHTHVPQVDVLDADGRYAQPPAEDFVLDLLQDISRTGRRQL